MNDNQAQPPAAALEPTAETPLVDVDKGEASEKPVPTDSQDRIRANFKLAVDMRMACIEQGAVSENDADNFQLIDAAPKASELKSEYDRVTQELAGKSGDDEEIRALRQYQSELTIKYAYNTVGLLHKYYKTKMLQDILKISSAIKDPKLSKEDVVQVFEGGIVGMGKMASDLATFHDNTEKLVPEIVGEFSDLTTSCDEQNAQFLTFLGHENQLKTNSSESSRELERFVAQLQGSISLDRIQNVQNAFQTLIDARFGDEPTVVGENQGDWVSDETPGTTWASDQTPSVDLSQSDHPASAPQVEEVVEDLEVEAEQAQQN